MLDLIIKNGQCYIDGELKDVDVAVKDGKTNRLDKFQKKQKRQLMQKAIQYYLVA